MRQKRAKAYRKLMHLYAMNFGFRQPYQVLVDSEICSEAVTQKIDLPQQLANVLQGPVKPMITQCCITELYVAGRSAQPAVDLAKTFERRRCNHREPISGEECIASVVGETNKHRYAVASLSPSLRQRLRQVPGVPIIHINRAVMILEPPSDATLDAKAKVEESKLHVSAPESSAVAALSGPSNEEERATKKKRGRKGPNPLSVKKKKPKTVEQSSSGVKRSLPREEDGLMSGTKRPQFDDGQDSASGGHKRKRRRTKAGDSLTIGDED